METPMQVTKNSEKSTENPPNDGKNDYKHIIYHSFSCFKTFPDTESLYRCEYIYQLSL